MSAYPNSGTLSKLDKKFRTSEKSPQYRGKIEIGEDLCEYIAQEYRSGKEVILDLSAWVREARETGNKFFSISVQKHYIKPDDKSAKKPTTYSKGEVEDMDDDIPF